jgi:hypothetical protein
MKKRTFFVAIMTFFIATTHAQEDNEISFLDELEQYRNDQSAQQQKQRAIVIDNIRFVLECSAEYNRKHNGITDLDRIWPGQTFRICFLDGGYKDHLVAAGETASEIVLQEANSYVKSPIGFD